MIILILLFYPDLDDNQQYSAGTRAWYSNMIVVTATLFAVYIA